MQASRHHCASCSWMARNALDLREAFGVDVLLEAGPGAAHLANYLDAVRVAIDQLVPQDAPR